jgi:hypothetical protein
MNLFRSETKRAAVSAESNSAGAAFHAANASYAAGSSHAILQELRIYIIVTYILTIAICFLVFKMYRDFPETVVTA